MQRTARFAPPGQAEESATVDICVPCLRAAIDVATAAADTLSECPREKNAEVERLRAALNEVRLQARHSPSCVNGGACMRLCPVQNSRDALNAVTPNEQPISANEAQSEQRAQNTAGTDPAKENGGGTEP